MYKEELPFYLYHYCLMPNHVHLLIQTHEAEKFSLFMKKLNLSYFHYYRKKYGWTGHFWQDRYKSQPVGKDDYFLQCGKYIELNPVRAGFVASPEKYPYSSYSYYYMHDENNLITEDFIFHDLGHSSNERQKHYHELLISDVVIEGYKGKVWGSDKERYLENRKVKRNVLNY